MGSFLRGTTARHGLGITITICLLLTLWLLVLIVLPQIAMVMQSFHYNLPPAEQGGPKDVLNLSNYAYILFGDGQGWNRVDLMVLARTIGAAILVTCIDLVICYPIAFILAHSTTSGTARLMVLGLIVPFWVNEILRAFAFRILFGATGMINETGMLLGLWDAPIDFVRANVALYAGLSYAYILLMIFPIYNAVEALDHNQIEAARDMGASWSQVHRRVVLPFAKGGIASGATMVFMLAAGALAAPQILGGPSSLWFTQIIYQWFNDALNWPRGSAYAIVLLLVCIALVLLTMRVFKVPFGAIGK